MNKPKAILKRNPEQKAFGLKVIKRRHKLGWTQEKLAEKCNLHPTYIGSVERGERNITLMNIIAIANALGCSPKDLMSS